MDTPEQPNQPGILNMTDAELDAYICGGHVSHMGWELALNERTARATKALTRETKRSGTIMVWLTAAIMALTAALLYYAAFPPTSAKAPSATPPITPAAKQP